MTPDRLARSIATTAATCLLLSSAGVVAQQAADSSTGRFEQQRRPRLKVEGLTAAEAREWNAAVERLADVLASNPVASSPPAGICTRLSTWIEERAAPPRATTTFGVSIPERFDGQTCSQLTGSGVEIRLNDPFPFLGGQAGLDPSDNDPEQMLMLPREEGRAGPGTRHAGSGRRWVVLTRGSEPLVVRSPRSAISGTASRTWRRARAWRAWCRNCGRRSTRSRPSSVRRLRASTRTSG